MKRLTTIVLLLVQIVGFVGCSQKSELTLDQIVKLSKKGDELTWNDFEQYESVETGSGLYILVYEIDDTFELLIGGTGTDEPPLYINLVLKSNTDTYVDIRTEDVGEFIKSNQRW